MQHTSVTHHPDVIQAVPHSAAVAGGAAAVVHKRCTQQPRSKLQHSTVSYTPAQQATATDTYYSKSGRYTCQRQSGCQEAGRSKLAGGAAAPEQPHTTITGGALSAAYAPSIVLDQPASVAQARRSAPSAVPRNSLRYRGSVLPHGRESVRLPHACLPISASAFQPLRGSPSRLH